VCVCARENQNVENFCNDVIRACDDLKTFSHSRHHNLSHFKDYSRDLKKLWGILKIIIGLFLSEVNFEN
jgi:hypothetical protein